MRLEKGQAGPRTKAAPEVAHLSAVGGSRSGFHGALCPSVSQLWNLLPFISALQAPRGAAIAQTPLGYPSVEISLESPL